MESTKSAWKVVSDPYAPESSWVAACAGSAEIPGQSGISRLSENGLANEMEPQRCELRRICETIVLSGMVALLGGVLAGQSVHLLYFSQHLVGQFFYADYQFAPWSDFYFWFNQPNAVMVYVPFFFSFSMGFLSRVNSLGRLCTVANFSALTAFFSLISLGVSGVSSGGFDMIQYDSLMLTTGIFGSALAHFFGGLIATNLSSITQPRKVFYSLAGGLVPASLLCTGLFLNDLSGAIILSVTAPVLIGFLVAVATGVTRPKTAALLALTAASPLAVCGLLHIPIAIWFAINSPIDVGSGLIPSAVRDLVYVTALPTVALLLPVFGSVLGAKIAKVREDGNLLFSNFGWRTTRCAPSMVSATSEAKPLP